MFWFGRHPPSDSGESSDEQRETVAAGSARAGIAGVSGCVFLFLS